MPCPRAIGLCCVLSLVACAGAFPLSNVSSVLPAEHEAPSSLTPAGFDLGNEGTTAGLDLGKEGTTAGLDHAKDLTNTPSLYLSHPGDIDAAVVEDAEIYHAMLHVHRAAKRVFESIEDMWGVVLAEEQRKRHLSTPALTTTPAPHLGSAPHDANPGGAHHDASPGGAHHRHAPPEEAAAPTSSEGHTQGEPWGASAAARALQP